MSTKSNNIQRTRTQTQLLPFNKKDTSQGDWYKKGLRSIYIWCFLKKKNNKIDSCEFV